jgi:hypothetical protein
MMEHRCKGTGFRPHYGMICKLCALGAVLAGLFSTGCTINRYNVVHNDQYLVIINGQDKESSQQSDDDNDGQVTTVPVGKNGSAGAQRSPGDKKAF